MGVILDTNYRIWNAEANSDQVGWPFEKTSAVYQRIAAAASEYRAAGFSVIKLPPSCLGAGGIFSDGYDKKDDYGLNGTAFGDTDTLRQCVAVIHAHGMQVYGDLVLHQYDGGNNGHYPTVRFPKTPTCFANSTTVGGVTADTVPDETGNFPFGDLAAYEHAKPPGYMHDGAVSAAQWLTETVGFDGYRLDDVKGTYAPVIYDILGLLGLFGVGEYFDGNNGPLWNWVHGYMQSRASCYDFGFKFNVGNICNNNSRMWMGQLANIGYCSIDPAKAVTFVESADSDNSPGQQTIWNKVLGYALMLTFPGYPQVYYRDWATDPNCYGLKPWINNLIWIHENLAQGDFIVRLDTDPQVFVHERTGYGTAPGCVCAFNNDQYNSYTRTVPTTLGAHQEVHEYSGNGSYNNTWTDSQGRLTFTVPRNDNGLGYLVFAKPLPGGGAPFTSTPMPTRQVIYGGKPAYNDVGPAMNGMTKIALIDVVDGSTVHFILVVDQAGWSQTSAIAVSLLGDTAALNEQLSSRSTFKITGSGWRGVVLTGTDLPAGGSAFTLAVEYTAPQTPSIVPSD